MNDWTPVEKGLPTVDPQYWCKQVLVTREQSNKRSVEIVDYKRMWRLEDKMSVFGFADLEWGDELTDVTAWREVPEPYRGEVKP